MASSSQALVRVAPVAPAAAPQPKQHPLGRSGLDLLELLATRDAFAARATAGSVELDVGLERARASLVRNLPGDALEALDAVWESAKHSEEGWYLRGGALLAMGLPADSDRICGDGRRLRPESVALPFLQSLSLVVLGDVNGARAVLQAALQRAPDAQLLLIQQALLTARQGDRRGAEALLERARAGDEEGPALVWGRAALRSFMAEETRQRSRPTPTDWPTRLPDSREWSGRATPIRGENIFPDIVNGTEAPAGHQPRRSYAGATSSTDARTSDGEPGDLAANAMASFGARIAARPFADVAREARMLMRAFSAGGTLAVGSASAQSHAARTILTTLLGTANGEGADSPPPVRALVEQLLPLLRSGRLDDAESLVRRQRSMAREPVGQLLLTMVRGAIAAAGSTTDAPAGISEQSEHPREQHRAELHRVTSTTPEWTPPIVRGESDHGPIVPVRLGLSLLEDPATARVSARVWQDAEAIGSGWGAAAAVSAQARSGDAEWAAGAGMRAVALVCVALAAGALVTGHGAIALGLAAGAIWLGLRRGARTGGEPSTHDESPRQ